MAEKSGTDKILEKLGDLEMTLTKSENKEDDMTATRDYCPYCYEKDKVIHNKDDEISRLTDATGARDSAWRDLEQRLTDSEKIVRSYQQHLEHPESCTDPQNCSISQQLARIREHAVGNMSKDDRIQGVKGQGIKRKTFYPNKITFPDSTPADKTKFLRDFLNDFGNQEL